MALLNIFVGSGLKGALGCRARVVRLGALMTSTSELIFYTVLLMFQEKCRESVAKFARYFRNIPGNIFKFKRLKNTAGR